MEYYQLIEDQKTFFEEGHTRSTSFRKEQLGILKKLLKENTDDISEALYKDLRKPEMEAISAEVMTVKDEIDHHLKKIYGWAKPKSASANFLSLPSKNEVRREPYGVTLIIGAWNYPLHLVLMPLIGAISGGNCAVVKPSELAPATSSLLRRLINNTFDRRYITVVEGGVEVNQELLEQRFDKIFFTGSTRVGKIVMKKAAEQLIPVTLELGGKSPAVVHKDADVKTAARRVTWGKFMNAGQTCIAPDFAYVHEDVRDEFLMEVKKSIRKFYGRKPHKSKDFARIINDKHVERLSGLMDDLNILHGGGVNAADKYIEPTVVDGMDHEHPIMKEEVFGPILPLVTYSDTGKAIQFLRSMPSPLSLYIFAEDGDFIERFITSVPHGGTCVNDVVMQISNSHLPFGGSGASGMGEYHGKFSFDCFTRPHAVMRRKNWPDPSFRYPPYGKKLFLLKKLFMR